MSRAEIKLEGMLVWIQMLFTDRIEKMNSTRIGGKNARQHGFIKIEDRPYIGFI